MIANEHLIDKIIEAGEIRPSDTVLELGCGTGTLTSRLVPIARKVYVCESDENLAEETLARVRGEGYRNIEYISGDALLAQFPQFDVCVSNLPFSLSVPILFKLIQHRLRWRTSVLVFQREFTDALIADPGERNYSRLSMNVSMFLRSERLLRINGAMFFPAVHVESALVRVVPRVPFPLFEFSEFDKLVQICFFEKKRSIQNVFNRPDIMRQLEANYKVWCAKNGKVFDIRPFPEFFNSVLKSSNLENACARKLTPEAMEHLLLNFHGAGIFFTQHASKHKKIEQNSHIEPEIELFQNSVLPQKYLPDSIKS